MSHFSQIFWPKLAPTGLLLATWIVLDPPSPPTWPWLLLFLGKVRGAKMQPLINNSHEALRSERVPTTSNRERVGGAVGYAVYYNVLYQKLVPVLTVNIAGALINNEIYNATEITQAAIITGAYLTKDILSLVGRNVTV